MTVFAVLAGLLTLVQLAGVDGRWGSLLNRPWGGMCLWCAAMAALLVGRARRAGRAPWSAGLVFFSLAAVYLSTFRWHGSDDLPTCLLPFSFLEHGTLTLDPYASWFSGYQWTAVVKAHGHLASFYPLPGAILSLPVYLPSALLGTVPTDHVLHQLSKCAASLIAAGAGAVFFPIFRRRRAPEEAFRLALLTGLGTSLFSTCGQGLWQHGPSCLALAAALWSADLARERKDFWVLTGALAALAVAARTTNALFAAAFMGMAFSRDGLRGWFRFCAGALGPAALLLLYWNAYLFGLPADIGFNAGSLSWPPSTEALAGFWASPGRGLLFFSPIALVAVAGAYRCSRRGDHEAGLLLAAAAGLYLLFSCFRVWTGAFSFGPRYLCEAVVVLMFFLPEGADLLARTARGRRLWRAAVAMSLLINATGGYARWRWEFREDVSPWSWRKHPWAFMAAGEGKERAR